MAMRERLKVHVIYHLGLFIRKLTPPQGRGDDSLSSCVRDSYLVDPASSHMLVSKIKPCMSKYKRIHTVKLRMAH